MWNYFALKVLQKYDKKIDECLMHYIELVENYKTIENRTNKLNKNLKKTYEIDAKFEDQYVNRNWTSIGLKYNAIISFTVLVWESRSIYKVNVWS